MVVRLFWEGSKTLWAVGKCRMCGEVHKFLADEALLTPMQCKSCGQQADLREHCAASLMRARWSARLSPTSLDLRHLARLGGVILSCVRKRPTAKTGDVRFSDAVACRILLSR